MSQRIPRFYLFTVAIVVCAFLSCAAMNRSQDKKTQTPAAPQWKNQWTHGAVFYEVFVRSFEDSNGDGKGDLQGLISKLDYLNDGKPETTSDLGIDAIWLMPIFRSPSYHGYDTTDYLHINPDYGTDADFDRLLTECHKRGIKVILDFVMNHTAVDNPWFLDSESSATSSKRNWYVWRPDNPGWTQPWGSNQTWHPANGAFYYGLFWSGMPDLNFRNQAVRTQIMNLAGTWLNRGVDGFRLDATRYLVEDGSGAGQSDTPETHAFLKEFSRKVRTVKPEAALVAENWTDTPIIATYFGSTSDVAGGNEIPMNFNFPLSDSILQGIKTESAAGMISKISEEQSVYPPGINDTPFLTNHDEVRIATQLQKDPQKLRLAASVLLTLPGAPFLYYGEEVGLENGPASVDEAKRTPMPWNDSTGGGFTSGNPWYAFAPGRTTANVADQNGNSSSLLSHYRNLIRLRKSSTALQEGRLQLLQGPPSVLAFVRTNSVESVIVVHNFGSSFLAAGPYALQASGLEKMFVDGVQANPSGIAGQWTFPMPPHSSGVWRIH